LDHIAAVMAFSYLTRFSVLTYCLPHCVCHW